MLNNDTKRPAEGPHGPLGEPRVYFIECVGAQAVKIGWSVDPFERLAHLQTGSPFELKMLLTRSGGDEEERQLHRRFAHLRGEWFRMAGGLAEYLNTELRARREKAAAWIQPCAFE